MSDLALQLDKDASDFGDLKLVDGDLVIVPDGIDAIRQHILQRLRTYFQEWFLDNTIGVPYIQQILVKNPDQDKIDAIFQNVILGTPGVTGLTAYSFSGDFVTRQLSVTFSCTSTQGVVDYSGLV